MAKIEKIIVHCSCPLEVGAKAILDALHKKRGWKGIGYHFLITNGYGITPYTTKRIIKEINKAYVSVDFINAFREGTGEYQPRYDGLLQVGRPINDDTWIDENEQGAHCLGLNQSSIGIVMIGCNHRFTIKQFQTLIRFCSGACKLWNLKPKDVIGHYETESGKKQGKTCPQIDMEVFRGWIKNDRLWICADWLRGIIEKGE